MFSPPLSPAPGKRSYIASCALEWRDDVAKAQAMRGWLMQQAIEPAIKYSGISEREAAALVGISRDTLRRWRSTA